MSKEDTSPPSRGQSALHMLRQVSRRMTNLADSFRQLNAEPLGDVEKGERGREMLTTETSGAERAGRRRGREKSVAHARQERRHSRVTEDRRHGATASEKIPLAPAADAAEGEGRSHFCTPSMAEDNVERSTGSDSRRADITETSAPRGKTVSAGKIPARRDTDVRRLAAATTGSRDEELSKQGTESVAGTRRGTYEIHSTKSLSSPAIRRPPLERFRTWVFDHLTDLFGSEMDFDTAYARAEGREQRVTYSTQVTGRSEATRDTVHATEHIQFFPLRFKDASLEKEYGQVCGQLFVGRDFLVLVLTSIMIVPVTWWLSSVCFRDIDLDAHSHAAWVAFQVACAVNLAVALIALTWLTLPFLSRLIHSHYEMFSYLITLLVSHTHSHRAYKWLSVLMVVMATFPRLVMTPEQMDVLFNSSPAQLLEEIKKLSPLCRLLRALPALDPLIAKLEGDSPNPEEARNVCSVDSKCTDASIQMAIQSVSICANELAAALGSVQSTASLSDVWLPFAFYVGFVKQTLQVFKLPLVALAVIIIHFGSGMMFMDSLSPSRTRFTLFLHVLVVPICAMPFILLRITYPSIVPVEESFFVVALAGYVGRYAQEFQHRLLFCSWRLTSKRLGEMHEKLKQQKKHKKSSTALEELIAQVKECQSVCMLASSRGRRADVSAELMHISKILDNILDLLTNTDNLYTVHFTEDAKENEVQRQFIELYNKPDKQLRKMAAPNSRHPSSITHKQTASSARDGEVLGTVGSSRKTFGSGGCPVSTFDQMQHMRSTASPVIGFEFGTSFHQVTSALDSVAAPFQALPMPELTQALLSTVGIDWDFDMLQLATKTEHILVEIGYALLCRLVTDWGCDENCLLRFLVSIQAQYLKNPYHNAIHGAEVAHLTECLTRMLNAQRGMNSIDKVTLTVASICHDVGHPGRNNQFFVNSYDPLAVIYNDVAVLENFHSCLTFRTLESRDCNVFANLDDSEFRFVRHNLIECILATDMKQHFESISRFRSSVPWLQHFDWSCRVVEEFYLQGDEELAKGLPLSPLCDREKHSDMGKSQAGFLEFVVKPLLKEIEEVDPFNRIKTEVSAKIEANRTKWLMLQEEGAEIMLPSHVPSGVPESTVTAYAVHRIAGLPSTRRHTVAPASAQTAKAAATAAATAAGFAVEEDLEGGELPHAAQVHEGRASTQEPLLEPALEDTKERAKETENEPARRASGAATTTEGTEERRRSSDYSAASECTEGIQLEQRPQQQQQAPISSFKSVAEPPPPTTARPENMESAKSADFGAGYAEQGNVVGQQPRTPKGASSEDFGLDQGLSISWEGGEGQSSQESQRGILAPAPNEV